MNLLKDGNVEFESCKELIEYIKQFKRIECEKDMSVLEETLAAYNALTEPVVEEDVYGALCVIDGDIDDSLLDGPLEEMSPSNGIILEVSIGGMRFQKDGHDSWKVVDFDMLKALPLGFTESEIDHGSPMSLNEVLDVISELLDEVVSVDKQFGYNYRTFRSVEDDIISVESQLDDLGYDGFFADEIEYEWSEGIHRKGHKVYGFRRNPEDSNENDENYALISTETAARYLAESKMWIEPQVLHGT